MRTLFPAASACFVIAFVASVGYAESKLESATEKVVDQVAEKVNEKVASKLESKGVGGEEPRVLSTAPLTHITYPDDRPTWITTEHDLDAPVHTWVVTTGGCDSMEMCEAKLEALKPAEVALYIETTTGWKCDDAFLEDAWIEDQLVSRRYVGTLEQGDQTLYESAIELSFDRESRERIRRARQNAMVHDRLRASGGLFALGLIGLCCSGGLLGLFSRRYS